MVSWPAALADVQFLPITVQPIEERLVTQMDNGLTKVRRRTSRNLHKFTVQTFMTGAEYETFKQFYNSDLEAGTLPFDWENPINDNARTMRFQPDRSPPWQFEMIRSAADPNGRLLQGVLHLETV